MFENMKKSLSVSKDDLTPEEDFECTYCECSDNVSSCRADTGKLALRCSGCGRHGWAESKQDTISTGPFFTAC